MAQDSQKASERVQPALKVMELVEDKLGLTRKQLSSPKQLCGVIYDDWGWPVNDDLKSKQTGNRSTSKANLVYLTDHDDRALDILHWRSKNTEMTKFLSGAEKCVNYLQSNWMYPVPKIYSTKTGRITYASRTGGKGIMAKASVGVAVHQLPNAGKSDLRTCYPAPPGYTWVNFDAAGQESRLMAHYSRDPTMLNVFKSGLNFHSKTGSLLTNQSYNDFASQLTTGCAEAKEVRRCAKFLNLSNNFRVGLRTARIIARVQHNINASKEEIKYWTSVFHTNYRQIKNYYWPHAIELAKVKGYAETLGGRRFYIDDWSKKESYTSGQDAIAVPIQGSAADMRTCGEMTISKKFPQFNFVLSIHDEIGYYVETKLLGDNNQIVLDARQELNEINYEKLWGETPLVPLLWDASVGVNLGVMKELK
jgi:DNA polymerase-1